MAAFTATDWGVTVEERWIEGKKRHARCVLTATVGSTNDTQGSLPLPVAADLGMIRNLDYVDITDGRLATDGSILVDYDQPNHRLKIYSATATADNPVVEVTSGTAITGTIYVTAVGW